MTGLGEALRLLRARATLGRGLDASEVELVARAVEDGVEAVRAVSRTDMERADRAEVDREVHLIEARRKLTEYSDRLAWVHDKLVQAAAANPGDVVAPYLVDRLNRRPFAGPRPYMVLRTDDRPARMPMPGAPVRGELVAVVNAEGAGAARRAAVELEGGSGSLAVFRLPSGAAVYEAAHHVELFVPGAGS